MLERAVRYQSQEEVLQELEEFKKQQRIKECEERLNDLIFQRLCKIPKRFQNKAFSDFTINNESQKKVKNVIERFCKTFLERAKDGNNIIFHGNPGTGKTLLSNILYQELVKNNYNCHYESSLNFLKTLQEERHSPSSNFESSLNKFQKYDLLIIDEVTEGCGRATCPSPWETQILFKIIDTRYQNNACTLVITNRSKHDLLIRLGEPTMDRLFEKGIALAFDWESYRK